MSIAAPICSHAATFTVTTTLDSGAGSLRQVILDNNAQPAGGANLITFNISGTGPFTIQPTNGLPTIVRPVAIDGYTQPGSSPNTLTNGDNAVLTIELKGGSEGSTNGLVISAGSCIVRGLVINSFTGDGILLTVNGGNAIQGNFIGSDISGSVPLENKYGVHVVSAAANLIGGTAPQARNVISGNANTATSGSIAAGIFIDSSAGNRIEGNFIGMAADGISTLPNNIGVWITGSNNVVGGTSSGAGNLISGNSANCNIGIFIGGFGFATSLTANIVQGNLIGTDISGRLNRGNCRGVSVATSGNLIGGTTSTARNLISGNADNGVEIVDGSANAIQGNFIGTDITGTAILGNHQGVVIYSSGNTVGGASLGARNIISGNTSGGLSASGANIKGNFIGTDVTGTVGLGNGIGGVSLGAGSILGGTSAQERNVISGNGFANETTAPSYGVSVRGIGNLLQGNFIGTAVDGITPLPNQGSGVFVLFGGLSNTIGGTVGGAGNVIAFNNTSGVAVNRFSFGGSKLASKMPT